MNAQTSRRDKVRTATRSKIRMAVEVARELGLDVAGFELSSDGSVRVFESRAAPATPRSDFDKYENEL